MVFHFLLKGGNKVSFLALQKNINITGDEKRFYCNEVKVFFSELHAIKDEHFPAVWLDLHLSGEYYEICGKEAKINFKDNNDFKYISISRGFSLRFKTIERIGIKRDVTGIVVNTSSRAVKGLSVDPGKVDPGFEPAQLTIVITNQSRRAIDLKVGDKIAAIAFAQVTEECVQNKEKGWANKTPPKDDYSKTFWNRIQDWLRSAVSDRVIKIIAILVTTISAIITLIGNYIIMKGR